MSFKVKVDGRRTDDGRADAGRKATTKAHPVTLWQVSKKWLQAIVVILGYTHLVYLKFSFMK
jgi:hypothetical protein